MWFLFNSPGPRLVPSSPRYNQLTKQSNGTSQNCGSGMHNTCTFPRRLKLIILINGRFLQMVLNLASGIHLLNFVWLVISAKLHWPWWDMPITYGSVPLTSGIQFYCLQPELDTVKKVTEAIGSSCVWDYKMVALCWYLKKVLRLCVCVCMWHRCCHRAVDAGDVFNTLYLFNI